VTASSGHALEILWEDGEFVLSRGVWDGESLPLLAAMPSSAQPSPETLARLQHAYALREELDPAWAANNGSKRVSSSAASVIARPTRAGPQSIPSSCR
jgi:hypothetical protein